MPNSRTLEAVVSIAGAIDPSLQKTLNEVNKQFSAVKISLAAIGTVTIATATAIVGFGATAVNSAAEFETQMANISTLLDGDTLQVQKRIAELGDDVLKVSNATGVTTAELSDGLYQIISAVGDSDDAIKQMELAAKAAAAGGAETTDAINLLTAVTKGYGDTSGEAFQKASDLSFMTVKLGQTSFPELASSMGKVVPLASALSVSQEELYGAFATLTGVTGSTAEVATQLKAVMSGLMSPTDGMTQALKSLGYENTNAALEALGLQGVLDALGGTVNGDIQQLAKMFSSVEAQTAILALAGSQAQNFTDKTAAMYKAAGATEEAFARQTDTLEYTIKEIKNLGANFTTEVGRKILPLVKEVAQTVLPKISSAFEKLTPVMDQIYSAMSPIILVIGKLITGILPLLEQKLSGILSIFQSAAPIILQIGGEIMPILSDAFGQIFMATEQLQPVFTEIISNIMPMLGEIFSQIFVALQQLAPIIGTFISDLIPMIGDAISAVLPVIGEIIPVVTPIISMVTEIISALLPALSAVLQFLMPIFKTVASIITDVLGNAIEFILPVIQGIIDVLTNLLTFITDVFTGNWEGAWEAIKSVFSSAFEALAGLVKTPLNAVISLINGVISGINKMGFTIPDWVPGLGGKTFKIEVPQIPMLAIGGFTNGPTIAGESGTEAVISFDPAYRNENLSYWAQAGRMLGADGNVIDLLESAAASPDSGNHNQNYFTFSPNITVTGKETPESFRKILKDEEEEFKDYILELLREKGFTYG